MQKMQVASVSNEGGFDAQRRRLHFFATFYVYSKNVIYAFNRRTIKKLG